MKEIFKTFLIIVAALAMGAQLHKCQPPQTDIPGQPPSNVVDTIRYVDTIHYYAPKATSTVPLGYKYLTLPMPFRQHDTLPDIRADTTSHGIVPDTTANADSTTLKLPIVQNVYEASTYKAYVSGVCPQLDSIFVYSTREKVTIKKPPKCWHIGPTVGYGITPHGAEPYIGISLTYSIISF